MYFHVLYLYTSLLVVRCKYYFLCIGVFVCANVCGQMEEIEIPMVRGSMDDIGDEEVQIYMYIYMYVYCI